MYTLDLNGSWSCSGVGEDGRTPLRFAATVPGCVHTDLLAAGLIEDPFWRGNAEKVQWIERRSWVYSREFTLDSIPQRPELVFEGLDTFCDVYLNGSHLGGADDMFISHTFDASGLLRCGVNKLEVYFYSPIARTEGCRARGAAFATPERLYARRIQCTYGWDWVARFVTCGIFRDVKLVSRAGMRVSDAYIYTSHLDSLGAQVVVESEYENFESGGQVLTELIAPDGKIVYSRSRFCREAHAREFASLASPELWFPNGYGAQPLYTLRMTVGDEVYTHAFGVRTLRLMQLPDAPDSPAAERCRELQKNFYLRGRDANESFSGFIVVVNGVKIMCKGADWVPGEPFPSAETDEKITRTLELAAKMNANMIRVWGGGIFEKDWFYSECDRLGFLVAQDFLMACGDYPEDEAWFIDRLRAEAEYAARLLRNHPCLAWWHGDNENATGACDADENYTGRASAYSGAEPLLRVLDHTRELLPSSPFGGDKYASVTKGTTHNTNFIDSMFEYFSNEPADDYKEFLNMFLSRFTSEEPTLGAVAEQSLLRFMTPDDVYGDDDSVMRDHMKNNPFLPDTVYNYMNKFAEKVLGGFSDSADRLFKLRYIQHEWIRVTLENYRRNKWFSAGILYWMLNDCWPASAGWALIDYYCEPKAAYYSFRRAAAPVIASIAASDGGFTVTVCSDAPADAEVAGEVFLLNVRTGAKRCERAFSLTVPANESVAAMTCTELPGEGELVVCDIGCDRAFYRPGKLILEPADVSLTVSGDTATVSCGRYVHALELTGGIFEDNYFSLLPGEVRNVKFTGNGSVKARGYTIR